MNNKYLVTLTARYDGASRLAIGHKWDFFPSFALGWNVHNEKFMKSVDFIKSLKLRGSIGLSGSQSVAIGQNLPLLTTDRVAVNQTIQNGYSMANIANPNLGWEHSRQINAGFDLGVFNNRVLLEFNIYQKNTTDLLINLPIPSSNGFGIFTTNAGEIENKGMELDLTVRAIDKKLKWNINGNISFNRNKMINLGPLGDLGSIYGQTYGGPEQPIHVSRVGLPVGSYFGYKIDGIYQNTTEVAEGPESSTARPGDFKFVDISGPNGVPDGIITADDRTIIGNPYPDYTFGLTNDLLWKGFSLSVFFQGTIGNDVINLTRYKLDGLTSVTFNVSQAAFDGRWQGEGTSNKYPAPRSLGNPFSNRFSDFVVEDGSFIRLKNVTLGYEIPVNKLGLSNLINGLKVFVTGTNLLTITKYTGYDPEVNVNYNSPLTPGVDNGTYPSVRTFSFGINLKL
jgi:TonB-linked SusC/RagA family outer membrane protein